MKKTIVKTVILAGLFLLCLQPLMAASPYTRPSDGARSNMQEMIDIGNRSARNWKDCKDREAAARKRGDEEMAKRWKDLADKYADLYFETRRAVVRWVDDMWNIPKPPNTTVFFDPNCKGKFGWCGGTKTDIKVGICPADFTDGPDLIASTKIHEMKHAWQIHNCMSSNAGYWKDCTYWGHLSEWEAYKESEKAHDEGIIKLEEEHKKRITEKIKEHQEGTDKARDKPVTTTGGGDKKEVADQTIEVPFTIHNPTDTAIEVTVRIKQDEAWPLIPPAFPPQIIGPEGEAPGTLMVTIPFDTPPYTCNPIEVSADGYTSDVVFITCVPSVEVLGGPPVSGSSGDTVPVSFTVENRGLVADTFDLSVSNPLGWACAITSPIPPQVNLLPGAITGVQATINIESAPTTFTTNLLFCTAKSQTSPTMTDTHWVPVRMLCKDVGVLGIFEPTGYSPINNSVKAKIRNINGGHVDSFFDVFYEIDLPGGGILESGTIPGLFLVAGEGADLELPEITFTEAGIHSLRVHTILTGDVDPTNDMDEIEFPVIVDSRVPDWYLLR